MAEITRDENGKLPAYAWPGGYPIFYLTADNGILCPDCANGGNGSLASEHLDPECPDDNQWRLVACDVHYEGGSLECDHCGAEIQSAYGDPEYKDVPNMDGMVLEDLEEYYQSIKDKEEGIWEQIKHYARQKIAAMRCRMNGYVDTALLHEKQCDNIYDVIKDYLDW